MQDQKTQAFSGVVKRRWRDRKAFPAVLRFGLCVLAVLIGYAFLEFPFNQGFLLTIGFPFPLYNIAILTAVFAVIYFLGQQSRASIAFFWFVCLCVGVSNHYLMSFRGTPVIPSDFFALGTAAEVSSGYDMTPDIVTIACFAVFVLLVALMAWKMPSFSFRAKGHVLNAVLGVLLAAGCVCAFLGVDAKAQTQATIKAFHMDTTYQENGTALCYVILGQQLIVKEPEGYSEEAAEQLMTDAVEELREQGKVNVIGSASAEKTSSSKKPTIIAVMNETFADMTIFDELKDCKEAYLANFTKLAKESVVSGYDYVPGYGASTCNSEFEFLTGSSLAFMGSGSYPYEYYDLSKANNLVKYFENQGYSTSAIHPAEASNWKRDQVYEAFGFDEFYTIEDFEGAEQLRGKTTDKETYKKILDLVDSSDDPQFIFDVTYQNHGGYASHLVEEDKYVHAVVDGAESEELNEYLSCIQQSDLDLKWLVEELEKRDEPIILVFFGDHGPSITNRVCGTKIQMTKEGEVNQSEKRYTTPYLMWANYDAEAPDAATNETAKKSLFATTTGYQVTPRLNGCKNQANMSLNYLGSTLIELTGLPLDEYYSFNASIRNKLLIVNGSGYMDDKTNWYRWDWDTSSGTLKAQQDYAIVQYWSLFRRE